MALNKYQPHLYVIPEDDANRQICVGFQTSHFLRGPVIQVLPNADDWSKVIE
ncbi:MAG: hypothetical protein JNL67_16955 [Planctomycetaceae bacterium]|nr:hypothetical protein [Planctomycetaceae bacterium]